MVSPQNSANRFFLFICFETTLQIAKEGADAFGTNPDANFDLIRFTSESLTRETANTTSAVIRSDRNVEDVIRTSISASCELAQELEIPAVDRVERAMKPVSQDTGSPEKRGLPGNFQPVVIRKTNTFLFLRGLRLQVTPGWQRS